MLTGLDGGQGYDKGITSAGKSKVKFRKAPKTENVYVKLLVKVCSFPRSFC